MLWEAPQFAEGLDSAVQCRAALLGRDPVYFVTACSGSWAGGAVGRVQSCRMHQLQGQLWACGAGIWVRFLSFMSQLLQTTSGWTQHTCLPGEGMMACRSFAVSWTQITVPVSFRSFSDAVLSAESAEGVLSCTEWFY